MADYVNKLWYNDITQLEQEGGAVMIEKSYVTIVEDIKEQIRSAQHRAILNANK